MQALEHSAYDALRAGATVLEADRFGDKVLRLADGNFLKLFRRKRLISSAMIFPYAQRFASNAQALHKLGIPCPEIIGVYRIASIERDAVHYRPLPGNTLRQLRAEEQKASNGLGEQLGELIARLHQQGVYFRSLHLGNVVRTPEQSLGLIDIADMRVQGRPLSKAQRLRNFRHLLRYHDDRQWLLADHECKTFSSYLERSGLNWTLDQLLHRLHLT